jgi:phospholipid/cholesterol/gamma-HCH transport system ATP-binding protein
MIKVVNLFKSYNTKVVLKGINLVIETGETLVILGRSGVGKSVLLRQIIGIEKPDSGYVDIGGLKITEMAGREQNKLIKSMGMLFQGAALFDSLNVYENVAFYLRQHTDPVTGRYVSEEEVKRRVEEALKMVGLEDAADKMPSDLSGGMRKRAALARLIIYRPKIVLYDEPTTGLDPITAQQINELIKKTKAELQATSIVVTHDIHSAATVADRIAFHHDGKIYYIDEKDKFFKSDDPILRNFFENATVPDSCYRES